MASIGHPILGDRKYMSKMKGAGKYQLLHAHRMIFSETKGVLSSLTGKVIEADMPNEYNRYFLNK